jgi:15-cis-phytoene synthase
MGMNPESERLWSSQAEAITAASGSNLALALRVLPRGRRRDMQVFYAFCRIVDDLADEPGLALEERRSGLIAWRVAFEGTSGLKGEPGLAPALRDVLIRHAVPMHWVVEIVRGCEMDLEGTHYRTWEELRCYCYRVASAVGLVSARIFGGENCEIYAEELGMALQLTNILRDSAEDFSVSGRVYFPSDELERFGVEPGSWVYAQPSGWEAFMQFQVQRARGYYAAAAASLPSTQRRSMVAAEIMRKVYGTLLEQMHKDGFRVWESRYRLSGRRKVWLAAAAFARTMLATAGQSSGPIDKPAYIERV